MAEFIVYDKKHWSEEASEVVKATWSDKEKDKFAGSHRIGDFVEVREDDYYSERGFNQKVFALIKVLGLKVEDFYLDNWIRKYNMTLQSSNILLGEWTYLLEIVEESVSGRELTTQEYAEPERKLISVIGKTANSYTIKIKMPSEILLAGNEASLKMRDKLIGMIENGRSEFCKRIKRKRWAIVPLAKIETITESEFNSRLVDKLTLSEVD
jgi:hypothetical protein